MNLMLEGGCQDASLRELGLTFGMDEYVIFSLRGQTMRRIAWITGYSEQELLTMAITDAEAVQSAENIRTDKRIRRCTSNLHE